MVVEHTNLVSRSIAEIFHHYNIKELHISLTNGLWRYENWGYPVVPGAPGAEVWAWFDGSLNKTDVDDEWKVNYFAMNTAHKFVKFRRRFKTNKTTHA